jgi:hypothetical protein
MIKVEIVVAGVVDIHHIAHIDAVEVYDTKFGDIDIRIVRTGVVGDAVTGGVEVRSRDELITSRCAYALVHSLLMHGVPQQELIRTPRRNEVRRVEIKGDVLQWKLRSSISEGGHRVLCSALFIVIEGDIESLKTCWKARQLRTKVDVFEMYEARGGTARHVYTSRCMS